MDFLFKDDHFEEEKFHSGDLIQIFPYGISLNQQVHKPVLLFKDVTHEYTMPVILNPIEAGLTITQSRKDIIEKTPHRFLAQILQSLDIQIKQCVFVAIKNRTQYVRIYFSGHPKMNSLRLRADEAMSMCLHLEVPFFASKSMIHRSREVEVDPVEAQLLQAMQVQEGFGDNEISTTTKTRYLN